MVVQQYAIMNETEKNKIGESLLGAQIWADYFMTNPKNWIEKNIG